MSENKVVLDTVKNPIRGTMRRSGFRRTEVKNDSQITMDQISKFIEEELPTPELQKHYTFFCILFFLHFCLLCMLFLKYYFRTFFLHTLGMLFLWNFFRFLLKHFWKLSMKMNIFYKKIFLKKVIVIF